MRSQWREAAGTYVFSSVLLQIDLLLRNCLLFQAVCSFNFFTTAGSSLLQIVRSEYFRSVLTLPDLFSLITTLKGK